MKTLKEIEAMSDEMRREKTAELCGWVKCEDAPKPIWVPSKTVSCKIDPRHVGEIGFTGVPDYLNSLDAMYDAERIPAISRLSDEWVEALRVIVAAADGLPREIADGEPVEQTVKFILGLSAKQRNSAFLMVML